MESDGQEVLERAYRELEREVPDRMARMLRWVRDPNSRRIRIPIGVLMILSSALWFLPVLGIEFLPAGLLLIAQDVPFLRKPVGYGVIWLVRRWLALRRWWQGTASDDRTGDDGRPEPDVGVAGLLDSRQQGLKSAPDDSREPSRPRGTGGSPEG